MASSRRSVEGRDEGAVAGALGGGAAVAMAGTANGHLLVILLDVEGGANSAGGINRLHDMLLAVEHHVDQAGKILVGVVTVRIGDGVGELSVGLAVDPELPSLGLWILGGHEVVVTLDIVLGAGGEQRRGDAGEKERTEAHDKSDLGPVNLAELPGANKRTTKANNIGKNLGMARLGDAGLDMAGVKSLRGAKAVVGMSLRR